MVNMENVKIEIDLEDLGRRVERLTNYADAGSADPQARNVLSRAADADVYAGLLQGAQLRLHELLGRHAKNVVQPPGAEGKWVMLLQVPPANGYALLAGQLCAAAALCLATDMAAHWLTLVKSDRADEALMVWRAAQQNVRNLSLWRASAPRITPVFL